MLRKFVILFFALLAFKIIRATWKCEDTTTDGKTFTTSDGKMSLDSTMDFTEHSALDLGPPATTETVDDIVLGKPRCKQYPGLFNL